MAWPYSKKGKLRSWLSRPVAMDRVNSRRRRLTRLIISDATCITRLTAVPGHVSRAEGVARPAERGEEKREGELQPA
ncbi:unnamed protein product [Caenorhabditis auriculariae]|uniref:Uncharacterized protein n=1 Tax=Caenorhabditis auriculariae TaxID=2777116 RepID=A0A8S1HYI5_9PELO|nr:unnamed protein product [Caenorhabditis auriculariae]